MNTSIMNIDKLIIQMKKKNELLFSDFSNTQFPNIKFKESYTKSKAAISSKSLCKSFYTIFYKGAEIGYLLDNHLIYSDLILIKFYNNILYSDLGVIKDFYNDLISNDLMVFDNFNKLEVSLNSLDSYVWNKIGTVHRNSADSYQCEKPLYKSNSKTNITIHAMRSNKGFIIQAKSKAETSNPSNKISIYLKDNLKDYQIQYYNHNGLNVTNELYRMEVRLNVEFFRLLRKNRGISFSFPEIFSINNQKKIFDYAIGDKLKFKILNNYTYSKSRNKVFEILSLYEPEFTLKSVINPKPIPNQVITPKLDQRAKNKQFRDSMISYYESPNSIKLNFIAQLISQINLMFEIPKLEEKGIPIEKLHSILEEIQSNKTIRLITSVNEAA